MAHHRKKAQRGGQNDAKDKLHRTTLAFDDHSGVVQSAAK